MPRMLIDHHDVVLLDLDGVVYKGPDAVPGVPKHLARVRNRGVAIVFVTNNAARTPDMVADHLNSIGVTATPEEVVTSAQVATGLVADLVPAGAPVLVVGGEGLVQALVERGLTPVFSVDDLPQAVVQGFHPDLGWKSLAEGAYAVARGLPWVVSNTDRTLPTERGIAPGSGALIEAIRIATGRTPTAAAGKPAPALFREAVRRSARLAPLVVGDRLDTDIAGAIACGYPSLLVLTGLTTVAEARSALPQQRPTYIGRDLSVLFRPLTKVETTEHTASST